MEGPGACGTLPEAGVSSGVGWGPRTLGSLLPGQHLGWSAAVVQTRSFQPTMELAWREEGARLHVH